MKKFRVKDRKFQRIIAATVCLVMVLGLVFQVNLLSAPETEQPKPEKAVTRVADESTMDGWKEFFLEEKDTSNAGKIWTDKTVVDGNVNLTSLNDESAVIERKNENNLLVGLSALSSSKTLTLEAAIPVDTMFVLDISGSMMGESILNLVEALNESIRDILLMNSDNRIGVVFYSGAGSTGTSTQATACCVLPLDRYTTNNDVYFRCIDDDQVQLSKDVQNSDGKPMFDEENGWFAVEGNTYIQNGLLQAFEKMAPKNADNLEKRIPILTLMSDGAPTAASVKYTKVGDSTIGEGNKTDIRIAFLTQLTAAWIKKNLEQQYKVKPLFYTVGLLDLKNIDNEITKYMQAVLDPQNGNNVDGLKEWWETFLRANENENVTLGEGLNSITVQKMDDLLKPGENSQYYADEFFSADNASALKNAFKKLVKKIKIQSAQAPTEVLPTEETENLNYSGYLVFEDKIGKYMEIKNVSGVTYAGSLHSGIGFAEKMHADGVADDNEKNAFIESLVTRLDISQKEASKLFENAQTTGQISYKDRGKSISNYIAWYADEGKKYLAPYVDGKELPNNAEYVNKSFFYYGNSKGTIKEEKMMYLGVRIEENIKTKEQKMYFFIPASLIPLVKYKISRNAANYKEYTVEKEQAYPVRLFYEVGLKNGINEYNLQQVQDGDLQYVGAENQGRIGDFNQSLWTVKGESKEAETFVDFTPSDQNEHYYFTENIPIYVKDAYGNYQLYKEEARPSVTDGKEYFFEEIIYKFNNNEEDSSNLKLLPTEVFDKLERTQNEVGNWIIPKGTLRGEVLDEKVKNNPESSNSAPYVYKTTIKQNTTLNVKQEDIRTFLGNNGKIVLRQGKIKISKEVIIPEGTSIKDEEKDVKFPFEMELKGVDKGNISGTDGSYPIEKGIVKFALKDGENIEFWLPSGKELSIEEVLSNSEPYEVTMKIKQNGQTSEPIETTKVDSVLIYMKSESGVHVGNTYNPPAWKLRFYKIDKDEKGLEGAIFNLYELNCEDPSHVGMHEQQILNEGQESTCWTLLSTAESSGRLGRLYFFSDDTIRQGTYRLVEEKAPKDYMKPAGQWNIYIRPMDAEPVVGKEVLGAKGERPPALKISEGKIKITNYKPIDLPITGGRGIDRFLILGAAVTVGGLMLTVHLILQRRRGKI